MDDVADVISKATVYHYYANKSLILFDIANPGGRGHWPPCTAVDGPTLAAFTVRLLLRSQARSGPPCAGGSRHVAGMCVVHQRAGRQVPRRTAVERTA